MSKVIVEREDMVAIADAIRAKAGITSQMTVGQMKTAVDNIEAGSDEDNSYINGNEVSY